VIAFIDVETTDLDERTANLLEVGIIFTDDELSEVAHCSVVVYWHPELLAMPDVVREMHARSGLLREVEEAHMPLPLAAAFLVCECTNITVLRDFKLEETPVAGDSVGFDRRWLRHHMPQLDGLFNQHVIDVSSINQLAKRWAPALYEARPKAGPDQHRVLSDCRGSIAKLRYYRESGFIGGASFEDLNPPTPQCSRESAGEGGCSCATCKAPLS